MKDDEENMRHRWLYVAAAMLILYSVLSATAGASTIKDHNIKVTSKDTGFSTTESFSVTVGENETILQLWIQDDASNVSITLNGEQVIVSRVDNTYICNISSLNTTQANFTVTYRLPKSTEMFEKQILYNTDSLTITYNEQKLFSGKNLKEGTQVSASLTKQVVKQVETTGGYLIYLVAVLVLIILALIYYAVKGKGAAKPQVHESKEILSTKKEILMNALKDIEKKHRAKEISDESYSRLKEEYKRDAVEVMRKLEKEKD